MLCKYKSIFGDPREGPHAHRIPLLDVATVDVVGTLVIAIIIYALVGHSLGYITLGLFILGILAHRIFGVSTKIDRVLFGDSCPASYSQSMVESTEFT